MKMIKKSLIGAALATMMAAGAFAADIRPMPANYESSAEDYMMSRMDESRGARVTFDGQPYQVLADFGSYGEMPAWAVDLRLRSRGSSGAFDRYMAYTVLFVDGEPVALASDVDNVKRLRGPLYAAK